MEIEEMQALWSEMSDQLEQQKKLTNDIIMNMTQERYTNTFKRLANYETLGAFVCYAVAFYMLLNFNALETWYLKACGGFSIAFLVILPVLVLRTLQRLQGLNIVDTTYKDTLIAYTKAKTRLIRLQQFSIGASFFLMFAVAAVFAKLWSNSDFFMIERDIKSYLVIGFALVFVSGVSYWGYRHYRNITRSAENLLQELE